MLARRYYFELLGDFYQRHPAPVASMAMLWTALWSHDLFAPIFCLLFSNVPDWEGRRRSGLFPFGYFLIRSEDGVCFLDPSEIVVA